MEIIMKKLWLTISLLFCYVVSFSQIDHFKGIWDFCEDDTTNYTSSSQLLDSRNGNNLSPHGQIRFLMIFVELEYDNPDDDPCLSGTDAWPVGQLPVWKDDLLSNYAPDGLSDCSITKYYQMASSNNHIVLGDYLVAPNNGGVFKVPTINGNTTCTGIVNIINQEMGNSFTTAHGFSSISDFDSWTKTGSGSIKPNTGNGNWDFVVFVIRNSKSPDNLEGSCSCFNNQLLGHNGDECAVVCTNQNIPTQVIRHEYAHELLGCNNFHSGGGGFSGGAYNYWIPQTGGWGILGLYNCSLWTWSAWDRYRLGWTGTGNHFEISARDQNGNTEVNGDLDATNPNQAGIYTLRDFATTGDALRIKLPFIKEDEEYPEWIWVENHQGFDNNECEFDRWQYDDGNNPCVEGMVPGMMLYLQINSEKRVANLYKDLYDAANWHADYTRPILANGHWDLRFLTDSVSNDCVSYALVRPFIRYKENPLTGATDQDFYTCDIQGDGSIGKYDQLCIWTEKTPDDGVLHRHLYSLGNSNHVFTLQGNHKIGMGTNPSTASQINMVGESTPYTGAHNLRTTYLNGVSIEMIEQCPNGDIRVRVRFDDVDIENNTRWCSHDIQLNKINDDGFSLNLHKNKILLLDQGLNATRMNEPIQFDGQSVFASPTVFTVLPEVKIHLDSASRLILDNASKLYFREASTCVVEDAGIIEVKSGTVFQMDECSLLEINGSGKLIVRNGAELRISPNAILAFQNGMQNLIIEDGVVIPDGFSNPRTLIRGTISNLQINGAVTWNGFNKKVNGQIIVPQGTSLNIVSSVLQFINMNSGIIVEPGGKLIIDNSVLTNLEGNCSDGMWQGIEVWGDSDAHQYLINGEYQQGYVELKNGATIENAVCALELWNPGYMTSTGGIVSAANAVFRNNAKAVHALHYSNHNPISGRETDYNAVFTRCEFVVDDDYLGGEDNVFYTHIDLDHVRGFKFRACDFSLETSSDNISHRANGIAGKEAGFSVIGICNNSTEYPCTLFKPSTFSGFFAAINAVSNGSKSAPAITVSRSDFSNNDFGVYMRKLSNSTIVFCNFDVKRQDDWSCGAGIFSDDVFNFIIEENTLKKENDFNGDAYGIIIKNSRGQNQIYRNTLNNLYCGNLAQGINTVQGNSLNYLGLEYRCNTNRGNDIDFYVLKENGVVSGIQSLQGSSTAAAGNTFSRNGYHFYNGGDHTVSYYYDCTHAFNNETPLIYNDNKFVPIPTKQSDGCPSNYLGEDEPVSFVLPPIERQQRERDYREAYTAYNSLKAVYDSRVDGGNTSRMLSDIASASSSDMWTLRSRLLGASPYLSGDVLLATSDRDDVFNESVLFEILMSNPDELKNDTLMNHLRLKDNPLPQYMTDILSRLAVDTTATLKTLMQNTMSELRSKYSRAAGDIVRSLVNDTVLNIGELRGWLGNMEDIHADRDIIATYIDEGNFTDALALANMLPTLYGLTGANLAEHNDYVDLLELYRDIYSDGRNTMQLNESETAMVEHIADYGSGYSQIMAQAVLGETDWEDYLDNVFECPTVTLPRNSGSQTYGSYFDDGDISLAVGMNFTVSPNPATTWASVDYILPNDATKASLDVVNSFSEKVMSVEVSNNSGQEVLDLRNLATGVYILILRCGEYVQMNKLIVTQ